MLRELYRYRFTTTVPVEDVEASLLLSLFALTSLYGESRTQLDADYLFDSDKRVCAIDASTELGRNFNRLFLGFLQRELSQDCYSVERIEGQPDGVEPAPAAHA